VAERAVAYIALGSNIGDREGFLETGRRGIASLRGTRFIAETPVEETAAIGPVKQGHFLNQMIAIETELSPPELLGELHRIERNAGRVRSARWAPRTLDLDIVMIDGHQIADANLVVPHPELPNRDFWRRELAMLKARPG